MAAAHPPVIGLDGCRAGWIGAIWRGQEIHIKLFQHFSQVLDEEAAIIAVDMPCGLPRTHGRMAEPEARQALKGRPSSIFAVPSRAAIAETDYLVACAANLRHSSPPRRISKQAFNLFPKIREIDRLLTPVLQRRVHEVHPELAFCLMNGGMAVPESKKTMSGAQARLALLQAQGLPELAGPAFAFPKREAALDDVLDACAAAWSARRILEGKARHFPETEDRDARGLLMRIHA